MTLNKLKVNSKFLEQRFFTSRFIEEQFWENHRLNRLTTSYNLIKILHVNSQNELAGQWWGL